MTGSVKDQMVEAAFEIRLDLRHCLVRIRGHYPSPGYLLDRQLIGEALHSSALSDPVLLFCGQGERRPEASVLQGSD